MSKGVWLFYIASGALTAVSVVMMVRQAVLHDWVAVALFAVAGAINHQNWLNVRKEFPDE